MSGTDDIKSRRTQTGAFLNLQRIQRLVDRNMQEMFTEYGLEGVTPAQANALMILFEEGEPITAVKIAQRMSLSPVTVGRFIKALESGGWVERDRHPTDSRAFLIKPTSKAFDSLPKFTSVANELLDLAFLGFDDKDILRVARDIAEIRRNLTKAGHVPLMEITEA